MAAQSPLSSSWIWLSRPLPRRARKVRATPVRSTVKSSAQLMVRRERRPRNTRRKLRWRLTSHLRGGGRPGGLFGGLLGSLDHIADTAHGLDELLRVAVVNLAAQVADVDVDDVGQPVVVHIPHVLH